MKYLFCNGCSFVYGENAGYVLGIPRSDNPHKKFRFSKLLSDKLNLEEINLGKNGESNHYTVRTTYDWIESNKDKVKDTIFILGTTEPIRLENYLALKKNYQAVSMRWVSNGYDTFFKNPEEDWQSKELFKIFGSDDIEPGNGLKWWYDYIKYYFDEEAERETCERKFKMISSYIEKYGGKCIIFNSIYDNIKNKESLNFFNFPEDRNYWKGYNAYRVEKGDEFKTNCHHPSHLSHEWFANELHSYINEKFICC